MIQIIIPKKAWSSKASELLKEFIQPPREFMCEDFRKFCEEKGLAQPTNLRAFGGIIVKASKDGMIKSVGHRKVSNPKAHEAFATIWQTT